MDELYYELLEAVTAAYRQAYGEPILPIESDGSAEDAKFDELFEKALRAYMHQAFGAVLKPLGFSFE